MTDMTRIDDIICMNVEEYLDNIDFFNMTPERETILLVSVSEAEEYQFMTKGIYYA